MRILLTGAGGFIGSFLCRDLLAAGHDVAVLLRGKTPWRLAEEAGRFTVIAGDLDDQQAWQPELQRFAPDAVAHLAWAGVANVSRNDSDQVKNIGWTVDLMKRARAAGSRIFLGLGSQAEYGPDAAAAEREGKMEPTTLYGEAKLATARIGAKVANVEGLRFVWLRVFSTFGPTDHPYWMIPGLIGNLLAGRRPALTGGDQLWDFLYVADAAKAIRLAIEQPSAQGFYALGSGRAPTLRSTIERIRDAVDPSLPLGFGDVPYRPDQVMRLQADIGRLQRDVGWVPEMDLGEAIARTVAWYRAHAWIFQDGKPAT